MSNEFGCNQDGAALLEAALVLPILLLLIFGLTEVSLYYWTADRAVKAVQLGARLAVTSDAIAIGPGLDKAESAGYWDGLPPGQRCFPETVSSRSPCPDFSVTCDVTDACRCTGGSCHFRFSAARLTPILDVMRAVMPEILASNVEITYTTNGLGYVSRPLPVPVDVTVRLIEMTYRPLFLRDIFSESIPLRALAQLPSESLQTR